MSIGAKKRGWVVWFIVAVVLSVCALAFAQQQLKYPEKPVTLIVPFSAGGGTDVGVRILVKYAEKYFGQSFLVVNIEGGGSEVGVSRALKSPPDGYIICSFNSASIILTTMRKASYHPVNDVEPICLVVSDPRLFAVRADDPRFKSAKDFIEYAKQNPGKLTIGTSGAGTSGHLSILALNKAAGVEARPVHFGGAGESRAAFLGGHIDAVAQTYGEVYPLLREGKVRIIAVATEERLPELTETPTFKELGINLVISSNRGFVAPKGTPRDIINKIAEAFKKATEEPGFLDEMKKMGLPVKYLGPEEWGALIKYEYELYSELAKQLTK